MLENRECTADGHGSGCGDDAKSIASRPSIESRTTISQTDRPNVISRRMDQGTIAIEKLEGTRNYPNWKFQMRMILIDSGLWSCIDPGDAVDDDRALAKICLNVHSNVYPYVKAAKNAKDAWKNLEQAYENKGISRRLALKRDLYKIQFEAFPSLEKYIAHIIDASQQLSEIGCVIDDEELAEIILIGLPGEFDPLIMAIEGAQMKLTSDMVIQRLKQGDFRKQDYNNPHNAFIAKGFKKIICHHCKKEGHIRPKCPQLSSMRRSGSSNSSQSALTALSSTATVCEPSEWLVDSGCSTHMTMRKDWLENFSCNKSSTVIVANNDKLCGQGFGNVPVVLSDNSYKTITDVTYVPGIAANLLSVNKMTEKGYVLIFDNKKCKAFRKDNVVTNGTHIFSASNTDGIYKLDQHQLSPAFACSDNPVVGRCVKPDQVQSSDNSINLWHKRLGHLSNKGLILLRNGLADGIHFNETSLPPCIPCIEGKQINLSFPKGAARRATQILELIHSDLCGPMPVPSYGNARYVLTLTDDCSRKSFVYFLKTKSQTEMLQKFTDFRNMVENQTGLKIKRIRTDNGTEYCNSSLESFFRNNGIIHETTIPYCPQQNGVSERLNRTIMEKVRSMLQDAGLDQRYWGEAVSTAIYLKNRSPTAALKNALPEEIWSKSRVDLSNLKVFGCKAYALIPDVHRNKLNLKSKPYIMVGYCEHSKGYRLADPQQPGKVIKARNITFLENIPGMSDNLNGSNHIIESLVTESHDNPIASDNDLNVLITPNTNCINSGQVDLTSIDMCVENSPITKCVTPEQEQMSNEFIENTSKSNRITSGQVDMYDNQITENSDDDNTRIMNESVEFYESVEYLEDLSENQSVNDEQPAVDEVEKSKRPIRSRNRPIWMNDYVVGRDDDDVALLTILPNTYSEAISSLKSKEWQAAMDEEYNSLVKKEVWELVDRPVDKNVIKCKWVFKEKKDANGNFERFKARLVARGFTQRYGIDYNYTFAPVVRHSTLRLLFSIAVQRDMDIDHIDVSTAFLNGELEETIYMEQHVGYEKDVEKVCLLKKGIYGLKQASRSWNMKVNNLLTSIGYKRSKCENCVYVLKKDGKLVIIALYVDDFFIFSEHSEEKASLINTLKQNFEIKELGEVKNCLGMKIERDKKNGTLKLSQPEYIRALLEKYGMQECKSVQTPMQVNTNLVKTTNFEDKYPYRELIGGLMYLSVSTRPDIAFACSKLSQFNNCFDETHWQAAKRVLRYLSGTKSCGLLYKKNCNTKIEIHTDADWANDLNDRRSYTGFCVTYANCLINWESRKQQTVAYSSTEAEYYSLGDSVKESKYLNNFFVDIFEYDVKPIIVYNDNLSAHKIVENNQNHRRTKHIDVRHHFIKDAVDEKLIEIKYKRTDEMMADIFTKPLGRIKHKMFINDLNMF